MAITIHLSQPCTAAASSLSEPPAAGAAISIQLTACSAGKTTFLLQLCHGLLELLKQHPHLCLEVAMGALGDDAANRKPKPF